MKRALKNKTAIHVYLVLKREARSTLFHREERKTRQHRIHEYFAIFKHDKRAEKQDSYTCISRSKSAKPEARSLAERLDFTCMHVTSMFFSRFSYCVKKMSVADFEQESLIQVLNIQ